MAVGRAAKPLLVGGLLLGLLGSSPGSPINLGAGSSSIVHFRRAVIGHRGSLLPRRFGTYESRAPGRVLRLVSAAGREVGWTRQAVGQQHNDNTPASYVLEVRRAVAQLMLVNRAGR